VPEVLFAFFHFKCDVVERLLRRNPPKQHRSCAENEDVLDRYVTRGHYIEDETARSLPNFV